jgi:hypothetical protein
LSHKKSIHPLKANHLERKTLPHAKLASLPPVTRRGTGGYGHNTPLAASALIRINPRDAGVDGNPLIVPINSYDGSKVFLHAIELCMLADLTVWRACVPSGW